MTRKFYKELAANLSLSAWAMSEDAYRQMCDNVATVCSAHNPRFDWGKFEGACQAERKLRIKERADVLA